ncbi:MAG: hypothetical protein QOD93_4392 [Acetobacteraceae bacterium]|jgi:hypothetical protein|nr:hypothetical protein [Acetobacteraceae bacterium]
MPYKFNESRRHKIPKAGYRVTNRPEYDAALVRRTFDELGHFANGFRRQELVRGRETLIVAGKESLIGPTARGVQGAKSYKRRRPDQKRSL